LEEIPLLPEAANFPFVLLLVYYKLQIVCLFMIMTFLTFRVIVIAGNVTGHLRFEVTTAAVCTKVQAWTFQISITTYQVTWCNTAKAQNMEMEILHFRKFL